MKQEDKDLLLRDLCARLPYGVKCQAHNGTLICVNANNGIAVVQTDRGARQVLIENLKPYIRPLLSMTEKEKKELSARWLWARCLDNINLAYLCDSAKDYVACSSGEYFELQDWLNAHHFDYRGLIGKGLALEAPKGMYIYN